MKRIWLIKMLYHSLSPSEKWEAHKHLKQPSMNDVLLDQTQKIDRNWLTSATYKVTQKEPNQ